MKYYNYLPCLLLALFTGLMASCSDDEHYDFPGDPDNKVYIKTGGTTEFTITHTPVSDATNFEFEVLAGCRMIPGNALTVDVTVDSSLVSSYNAAHNTKYKAIPADYFNYAGTVIEADTMGAKNPVVVTLKEDKLKDLKSEDGYLVPVKLSTVTGGALPSTNLNTVYAVITVQSDNDNIDDKSSTNGELNTDRSGWSLYTSLNAAPEADGGKAFDADASTSWSKSESSPFDVIIDMGKSYNVSGIYANYKYYGYYDEPVIKNGTEIFISEDNSSWTSMGKVTKDSQNIAFYAPVKARYVKWTVPESQDWWGNKSAEVEIGDFNVYVK